MDNSQYHMKEQKEYKGEGEGKGKDKEKNGGERRQEPQPKGQCRKGLSNAGSTTMEATGERGAEEAAVPSAAADRVFGRS